MSSPYSWTLMWLIYVLLLCLTLFGMTVACRPADGMQAQPVLEEFFAGVHHADWSRDCSSSVSFLSCLRCSSWGRCWTAGKCCGLLTTHCTRISLMKAPACLWKFSDSRITCHAASWCSLHHCFTIHHRISCKHLLQCYCLLGYTQMTRGKEKLCSDNEMHTMLAR